MIATPSLFAAAVAGSADFGMVPAALLGVDLGIMLHRALTMVRNCESWNCPIEGNHNGACLGAVMSELAVSGCAWWTRMIWEGNSSCGRWRRRWAMDRAFCIPPANCTRGMRVAAFLFRSLLARCRR